MPLDMHTHFEADTLKWVIVLILVLWAVVGWFCWTVVTSPPVPPWKAFLLFVMGGPLIWTVILGGFLVIGVLLIFCWVRGSD